MWFINKKIKHNIGNWNELVWLKFELKQSIIEEGSMYYVFNDIYNLHVYGLIKNCYCSTVR